MDGWIASEIEPHSFIMQFTLCSVLTCALWSTPCLYLFFTEEMCEVESDE